MNQFNVFFFSFGIAKIEAKTDEILSEQTKKLEKYFWGRWREKKGQDMNAVNRYILEPVAIYENNSIVTMQ